MTYNPQTPAVAPQLPSNTEQIPYQSEQNMANNQFSNYHESANNDVKFMKPKKVPSFSNKASQQKNPDDEKGKGCGICNGTGEGKRKIRCRNCPGCKATKCGKCTPCTRPTMKKPCLETVCQAYVIPRCPKC